MNKNIILITSILFFSCSQIKADEGMWLPILLEKYNIEIMQAKGCKLSAEDIYSVNQACLKDAVVTLNYGCTGEIISDRGLMLTNHHCALRYIQSHSSIEHDYLTDGFWAMSAGEELPNKGMSVLILKRMEDVSDKILKHVTDEMDHKERQKIITSTIDSLKKEAVKGSHYEAEVESFYYGSQYYLFVMERFEDIRLVGAPPSAIGNFGGDTDNWMWPRHTGDFSVLRIYANQDNKPAKYSVDNVPYKPKKHFSVSLKGVNEGDFTMVFGYPGSTAEYLPSYALEMLTKVRYPSWIKIRDKKLEIINAAIESDPKIRIQYTAKAKWISNSWKRWKGEINGLKKLDAINKKNEQERKFSEWAKSSSELQKKYGELLPSFKELYKKIGTYAVANDYIYELVNSPGMEIVRFTSRFKSLVELSEKKSEEENVKKELDKLKERTEDFFKDYHTPTGKKLFIAMLDMYNKNMKEEYQPEQFKQASADFNKFTEKVFKQSFLDNKEDVLSWIKGYSDKSIAILKKDPVYKIFDELDKVRNKKIKPEYDKLNDSIKNLMKIYVTGLMEMQKDKVFYPDANSTLRLSYGQVSGYFPGDGIYYEPSTTLKGIIEKDNPQIYDYDVPDRLKELYNKKDFGNYEYNGQVNVCFIATNHTTGGNSGSPVLNGNGELIGINFDRAWEGVMSDLMFNPDQCRNISVDIRYVLFLIDKYAGAGYLLDEMTIIE